MAQGPTTGTYRPNISVWAVFKSPHWRILAYLQVCLHYSSSHIVRTYLSVTLYRMLLCVCHPLGLNEKWAEYRALLLAT